MIYKGNNLILDNIPIDSNGDNSSSTARKIKIIGLKSLDSISFGKIKFPIMIMSAYDGISAETTLQINDFEAFPIMFYDKELNNYVNPNYNNWVYNKQIYTVFFDSDKFICFPPNIKNINDNTINSSILKLSKGTLIENNYVINTPDYIVGNNSLEVYWNGNKLIKYTSEKQDGQYIEVGDSGSTSSQIKIYRTTEDQSYTLPYDVTLEFITKGD